MPAVPAAPFPETLYFSITIDGSAFPYATYGMIRGGINGARVFSCKFNGQEAVEQCHIGSIVEVSVGRGNLTNLIDDKKFIGVIKNLNPSQEGSFTAYDYTTFLAESQFEYYKAQDYVGQDLYFAAANACNYKGIDVSRLTQGSGIFITEDMDLFGWKSRKEFIDACFNDNRHPINTIRQWQYAIRGGKIMDFFLPDEENSIVQPNIVMSKENNNILDGNIVSNIDTTRLINAITVVSSTDETIYAQLEDVGSQKKYGVRGSFLAYPSTNKNILEEIAYKVLNRFTIPTISYSFTVVNADNLDLGDLVKIDMPSLPKEVTKTIVEYEVELSDIMAMRCKIGAPELNTKDYINLISKPTNR